MGLSTSEREKVTADYAARSLNWLKKSAEAGYFQAGANLDWLRTDRNLTALRSRPDFHKLLDELDQEKSGK
jgi:hypothetical protein